jgi:hypothetical protein
MSCNYTGERTYNVLVWGQLLRDIALFVYAWHIGDVLVVMRTTFIARGRVT